MGDREAVNAPGLPAASKLAACREALSALVARACGAEEGGLGVQFI